MKKYAGAKNSFLFLLNLVMLPGIINAAPGLNFPTHSVSVKLYPVHGKVTDEQGVALPGVNIKIKGGNRGVSTDAHGHFELQVDEKAILIFSYLGYQSKEIAVAGQQEIQTRLVQDKSDLNEIVVVGYGTQKRSDLTGSVVSVPTEALRQPLTSFDRALQGAVPGVQVTQTSGQPGAAISIRIRGGNSITAGNEPLYVIDGFPVYNDNSVADAGVVSGPSINALAGINASDIESIDILKDASATAIYGSRGANGVVIITTKKGKAGTPAITYDGSYGVQQVIKKLDLLDAAQWGQLKNDALADAGKPLQYTPEEISKLGKGTDWQSAAFRTAPQQNHQLTISGGNENVHYLVSGGYIKQEGILRNTDFDRISGRVNLDINASSKLKLGINVTGNKSIANIADQSIVLALLRTPPTVSIYDDEGKYTIETPFEGSITNPVATLNEVTNQSSLFRFLGNAFAEYEILEGLKLKVSLGGDVLNNKQNRYLPTTTFAGSQANGSASVGSINSNTWLNENTLSYSKSFNRHSLDLLAGFTQQEFKSENLIASGQQFVNDQLKYNNLGSASFTPASASGSREWALNSFLGRVNYAYDNRYFVTATFRADGSSRFGTNNKWGYFPSGALSWKISNEKFFAPATPYINSLKLRLSAGSTGNQEIGVYQSLATLGITTGYVFNDNYVTGFAPNKLANPNLGWETTNQYNAGLDFSIVNNRIGIVLDAYYKKTKNLLLDVPVPTTTGQVTSLQNYGAVQNKGFELEINSDNLKGDFTWNTSLNFSLNRNKVLSLGGDRDYYYVALPSDTRTQPLIVKVGEPLISYSGYIADGILQTGDEKGKAFTLNPSTAKPGDLKFKDLDNDGQITQEGDRRILGNSQPKFIGGFRNTFTYKGFDLSVFLQGSYGNMLYNKNKEQIEILNGGSNAAISALDRWTPQNPSNELPRAKDDPAAIGYDRYFEDGSYLRLKNITLGYKLPLKNNSKLKQVRIWVGATNLYTWTKYTGFDPEVSYYEQNSTNQGFDYGVYPNSKSFTGGINITF
ncbi:TonB-dependent receptor [Chitinophaga sp. MM2321]|uniref:SusC/RagA family TonB-linked outer membrane protein n=1 Tax=Chitinophaga sp. MM2321 TaxID=3137178 RepID=UPI0032D5A441